jgi:hypothetical protein
MIIAVIRSRPSWLALLGFAAGLLLAGPALAQQAIQSQDSNVAGIVAEITECKRQDGVVTVRMRLRNTGDTSVKVGLITGRNYDSYYLTAGGKKYFILRDSEKTPLAPHSDGFGNLSASVAKGASYVWWAKFPAPPADVKKVSYFTPITPPFDNVPITD